MLPFKMPSELMDMTQIFQVERNGSVIGQAHGFFCGRDYPNTIQLVENTDVKNGDYLIDTLTSQKYFAVDATPIVISGKAAEWMVKYETLLAHQQSSTRQTNINIHSVSGNSVIGSQEHVVLNIGSTLDDIENLLNKLPITDQAMATELLDELKRTESANHPVLVEGALSKFSDLLKKHTDLLSAVGGWAVQLLIGK